MKIVFHTKNIDQTFYRQIIHTYITEHLITEYIANQYLNYEKSWVIHIHPTTDWDGTDGRTSNTGVLNGGIPHGVTGEGIVKVFVVDVDDKGLTSIQNFSAICHEIAHMLLLILMRGRRGIYRNADLSGHKPGMDGNVSTQEVHDRQMEGKLLQFRTYINAGNWFTRRWIRYTAIGIDLRDFLANNL